MQSKSKQQVAQGTDFFGRTGRVYLASVLALLLVGVGLALVLALATGCTGRPAVATTSKKLEGVTLTVACPPEAAVLMERHGRLWAVQSGATLQVVTPEPGSGLEGTSADVWMIRPAELGRWAAADLLQPVPETITARGQSFLWEDLLRLYRYKLLCWGSTSYAMPLQGDGQLCFYRQDLFQDPEHQKAFRAK
jgi:ABC-type glycerol-3-phosphate transport system substrate-binding protein